MLVDKYGPIMSVQDVQDVLHVGKNRVYELMYDGSIRALRIGRSWKIPTEAVQAFIDSWRTNPAVKKVEEEPAKITAKATTTKAKTKTKKK